jgi:hypothetical protein
MWRSAQNGGAVGCHAVHQMGIGCGHQVIFALKVVPDQPCRDTRLLRNGAHRSGLRPAFGHQRQGGGDQGLTAGVFIRSVIGFAVDGQGASLIMRLDN